MKVVHTVTIGTGEEGGKETFILALLRSMAKQGLDVTLISFEDNLVLRELKEVDTRLVSIGGKLDIKGISRLRHVLEGIKPDIIHTHSYRDNFYGRLASKDLAVKRFTTLHLPLSSNLIMPYWKRWIYQFIDNRTNYLVDGFIAVSRDMKAALLKQDIDEKKIRVILNGLDLEGFDKEEDNSKELRKDWLKGKDGIIIGCIGRLTYQKGQRYLIEAVSRLKRDIPNITLVLLGKGVLQDEYISLAQSLSVDLILAGFRRDIYSCLKAFDAFVLPSIDEGLPITLLEAAGALTPIVATSVGGVPEFLRDRVDALLVRSMDVNALSDAIRDVLYDKDAATKRADEARLRLEKDFTIDRTTIEYITYYEEILKAGNNATQGA